MELEQHVSLRNALRNPRVRRYLIVAFNNFRGEVDFDMFDRFGIGNGHQLMTEFIHRILIDGERFYGKEKSGQ